MDFHLYPLNFLETVKLKKRFASDEVERLMNPEIEPTASALDILYKEFELYLIHGGFLTAINDIARHNRITPSTFATYSDWIRGDVLKRGRQEHYLREILGAIIKRYGTRCMANRKR